EVRARARRSNAIYEAIAAAQPDGPIPEAHSIALNDYNIGHNWFMDGNLSEAAAALESAIRVCEETIRRGDKSRAIRLDLAQALVYLGRVRLNAGRHEDAVGPIRRAVSIYRELLDQSPLDYSYAYLLHLAHEELGFVYMGLERPDDVIACHEAARGVLKAT